MVAFLFIFKKAKSDYVFFVLLFYCILFFLFNKFFDSIAKHSSLLKPYYFLYTFFEYFSFTLILFLKIKSKYFRRFIILLSIAFIFFQVFYFFTFKLNTLDSVPVGIETISIFIFVFFYFNESFKEAKTTFLHTNYVFWIIIGIMIYMGGSFFFNILAEHLGRKQLDEYWSLTYLADIFKNIFITISIFIFARQHKKKTSSSHSIPYLDLI